MDYDMKIAICDDEKPIRDYIEKCVREINPDVLIMQYADASDMVSASFDADILFLDILKSRHFIPRVMSGHIHP